MAWIAPVVQVATSMMGQQAASDAYNSQDAQARAALAAIRNIQLPDAEKQKLLLELPQLVGELSPEMEQYYQQDPSAMENINITPAFEEAQLGALQALQERGEEGMTADQATDNRLRLLAELTAVKTVLSGLYGTLVANAEIKSLEDQHEEYKRELRELAKRFIPEAQGELVKPSTEGNGGNS